MIISQALLCDLKKMYKLNSMLVIMIDKQHSSRPGKSTATRSVVFKSCIVDSFGNKDKTNLFFLPILEKL